MPERRRGHSNRDKKGSRPVGLSREIAVENRLEALATVCEGLERFAGEAAIPDSTRRALLVVVEEFFTNIVRYGYDRDVVDHIAITAERNDDAVRLVFRDRAKPFDIAATPAAQPAQTHSADMKVGGLGLLLVHELTDSLAVHRDGGANVTEFRFSIQAD